jgi:uncharacterized membrane protein YgcG
MRIARLLGVILTFLTAGLLLAPSAGAQPPARLTGYVTDNAGALSDSGRADVRSAIDGLYAERHIRLWVVYVDNFSGQSAVNWAQKTMRSSDLGDYDALLAVATTGRAYAFLVPPKVQGVSGTQVDDLRHNQIEPALHDGDWGGAAVAAANGLKGSSHSSSGRTLLLVVLAAIVVALLILLIVMRIRARRRRAREVAAAQRIDPTDENALATVPIEALDELSRSKVVEVDNALRTSTNELALAVDEFGAGRTEPFSTAVNNAKTALAQAFTVRHQIDDGTPLTPAQRRELLTKVVVSAARADLELESQTEAFEKLRDLVINAPSLLDALTQQYVELTTRVAPTEQRLAELHQQFDDGALGSVAGNVATAKERLAFADRNIGSAREQAGRAEAGQQGGLVDSYRAAESALGQARSLLDAVDSAADDIRRAISTLPSAMTDIAAGIEQADARLRSKQDASSAHTKELIAARDAAAKTLEAARKGGSADPLTALTHLTKADADLDRILATLAEEDANAERLSRSFDQVQFTADSRVRGVSEYIDNRRGSVGAEARTKLEEAKRHLQAAQDKRSTNVAEAIAHANAASTLAAQAQSLANADVRTAQRTYSARSGDDTGAMLGGIIIGDLLRGGTRGGFGGWSPTSFGGSSSSSGSSGGYLGGGGRF